jgi:retinol dehydrogenase-12
VNPLRLEAVKDGPLRRQWLKKIDYGFSKFVRTVFLLLDQYTRAACTDTYSGKVMNLYTSELAKRYKDSNIVAIAVHPGKTSILIHIPNDD